MDVADDWIAERVGPGDIAVTADVPLADRCLKKGARAIGPKGREFTDDMIGEAMATRALMDQLRSAGEVTGGLHGANRMGGNALTETLVFGKRAGEAAAAWVNSQDAARNKKLFAEIEVPMVCCQKNTTGAKTVQLQDRLKKILWEEGGILKNRKGLMQALKEVKAIQTEEADLSFGDHPKETLSILDLRSGARTAELILQAALRRQESRGAHFREDFPRQDDGNWRGHLQVHLDSKGHEIWKYHPNSS